MKALIEFHWFLSPAAKNHLCKESLRESWLLCVVKSSKLILCSSSIPDCEMNIHKSCAKQVEEVCIGQLHKKDRSRDTRFSAILGKIISDDRETKRKVSQVNAAQSKYLCVMICQVVEWEDLQWCLFNEVIKLAFEYFCYMYSFCCYNTITWKKMLVNISVTLLRDFHEECRMELDW